MQPETPVDRPPVEWLGAITTRWSLFERAHGGDEEVAQPARRELLERYGGAVRRYLRKVMCDPHAADDVFQEFALCLMRGELCGATPKRGRFRNFVKGTLFHLIADHRKRERRWPRSLQDGCVWAGDDAGDKESDRRFLESWREELLAHAWAALADADGKTGQCCYDVLRFRAQHPEMRSGEMAEQLAAQLGKSFTSAGVRQVLHRARERFAKLLLEEVSNSLESLLREELEQELVDVGLLEYCRPALEACSGRA
jgi:DNA-directed RNA polymerase specialized sigma24 family protein